MKNKKSAILILSHLMDKNGNLGVETLSRVEKAMDVYHACDADFIITSGWDYRKDSPLKIGQVVGDYCIDHYGLSSDVVLIDTYARDTVGDAFFIRENIVDPRAIRDITVVTSDYHVDRTKIIFEQFYSHLDSVDVIGAPTGLAHDPNVLERERQSTQAFLKTFADIDVKKKKDAFMSLSCRHPFYNGDVYQKIA